MSELSDQEIAATAAHIAAKDAYRNDPTAENKAAKEATGKALIDVRNSDRAGRPAGVTVTADAFSASVEGN